MAQYTLVNEENTSGLGKDSVVPTEIEHKFNWGACFWTWIWGVNHKSPITLIILPCICIPVINIFLVIGLSIWFGINGNKWAWQNKKWDSIEAFQKKERYWAKLSVIMFILQCILAINLAKNSLSSYSELDDKMDKLYIDSYLSGKKIAQSAIKQAIVMNYAFNNVYAPGNQESLINMLQKQMRITSRQGNILREASGNDFAVKGNGRSICDFDFSNIENNCTITVDVNGIENPPNKVGTNANPSDRWRFVIGKDDIIDIEEFNKIAE